MKTNARTLLAAAILALSTASVTACLWDSDTLAAESARFPGISQLITHRLDARFAQLRTQKKKAFVAYVCAGDPTLDATIDIVLALPSNVAISSLNSHF